MNILISFELAKLLKEKGFDKSGYLQDRWLGNNFKTVKGKVITIPVFGLGATSVLPPISEVVMWLYEKHGVWIIVDWSQTKWCFSVIDIKEDTIKKTAGDKWKNRSSGVYLKTELDFNSPMEAYQSAIEYTLKNLIK